MARVVRHNDAHVMSLYYSAVPSYPRYQNCCSNIRALARRSFSLRDCVISMCQWNVWLLIQVNGLLSLHTGLKGIYMMYTDWDLALWLPCLNGNKRMSPISEQGWRATSFSPSPALTSWQGSFLKRDTGTSSSLQMHSGLSWRNR